MIGKFIAVLFLARDIAHREHLAATGVGSYARHMALGEFYDEIVDLADELAEAYQGRHGLIDIPYIDNLFPGDAIPSMRGQLDWIEANRYKAVAREDTTLQNIIDTIVARYLSTIYKLTRLK